MCKGALLQYRGMCVDDTLPALQLFLQFVFNFKILF